VIERGAVRFSYFKDGEYQFVVVAHG
jgi:hypothetical protein